MTYDITFVRRAPDRTLLEALDDRDAAFDPDAEPAPMRLSAEQRTAWERVVDRVALEVGPVSLEEYPSNLTMWRDGPAGLFQLDYDGESADLAIAHRYTGDAALAVVTEVYRVAAIVETETGLEGFDAQTGRATAGGVLADAAASLSAGRAPA